jgi:hypothetical protein
VLASRVEQLGGERPLTHTGGVRLHDSDDVADLSGRNTGASDDCSDANVRRGNVGIGAKIYVELRAGK